MNYKRNQESIQLEPRVAKLETGLDILTREVTSLATVVREQSSNMEHEVHNLAVAVTQASGPRKVDWQTILSAIMLIMAIGSAVFWPLNQTSQNNKSDIITLSSKFDEHKLLNMHPVGEALLQRTEERFSRHIIDNERQLKVVADDNEKSLKNLKEKLDAEKDSFNAILSQKIDTLKEEISVVDGKISRINDRRDKELDAWRSKFFGISPGPEILKAPATK